MKSQVRVAVAQTDIALFDENQNLSTIERLTKQASQEKNADLVVFPELANIGYIKGRDKMFGSRYYNAASKLDGEFVGAVGEIARATDTYIVTGMAEAHPTITGTLYNSAILIDPRGKLVGVHRKQHIPGYEKHYFIPANTNDVFETDLGTLGLGICYDNQFPELSRSFALKGAEILIMLWNMPTFSNDGSILHQLTSIRAFENRMFAVSSNRVGENNDVEFFGHSAISDPLGIRLAEAYDEEALIVGTLERDRLTEERAQMTIFRDRRPDLYSQLVQAL